ncbi:MAG: metallophosphoesterase [Candidatus Adiutrix sp.]|jgi:predicted MPP superfamily phosphohydrolase|nr:metallophosphoesterase [Candidatus Adiutrix sp.]
MTIICLALLSFSAWYVPFRLKRLGGLKRAWPLAMVIFPLLAGFFGMLVKGLYASAHPAAALVYNILGLFFIFQIFLFFYLLMAHILGPLLKKIPNKALAAAGPLICLGLVGFGFFQARSLTVTEHEVKVRGLARPVSLMHISDLHLGARRGEGYVKELLKIVERHQPDLVIYNGDMVDSNIVLSPELFALFASVRAEQYFTTGNHEYYIDTEKALGLMAGAGIRVLRNEMVETRGFQLIGLEYMNADRRTYDSHMVNDLTIEEELPKIPRDPAKPSILVHHSPVGLPYVAAGNIGLMLSGHTHGGQVFPGTALIGFRFPMNKGRYQVGPTTLLVSQGAGTFGPWMRLGTFNEIQLVKLAPE